MFKHIVCPIDGSDRSLEALEIAASLAADQGAKLTILTVSDPAKAAVISFGETEMAGACLDAIEEEGRALVADAARMVGAKIVADTAVVTGEPVAAISSYANEGGGDLIVMGSHGRTGLSRVFLGSVAEGVVHHADIPVMIIRRPAAAAAPSKAHAAEPAVAKTP